MAQCRPTGPQPVDALFDSKLQQGSCGGKGWLICQRGTPADSIGCTRLGCCCFLHRFQKWKRQWGQRIQNHLKTPRWASTKVHEYALPRMEICEARWTMHHVNAIVRKSTVSMHSESM